MPDRLLPQKTSSRGLLTIKAGNDGNGLRCLVVDDEPQVLRYVVNLLVKLGFEVDAAQNPQALSDSENGAVYHLLVTDLVTRIVQALVDRPQEVEVSMIQGGGTMVLELRVAKDDIVKIIGRQGRTAQAMRTLIGAVAAKTHTRAVLEIIE